MQSKPNSKREREKQLRKAMRIEIQVGSGSADKMHATAICGKSTYTAESGTDTKETKELDKFIDSRGGWPWDKKSTPAGRPHKTCAEAKLYAKLIMYNEKPKKFSLISYNAAGKLAPPCANCQTWVGGSFASVKALTATYRAESTQSPTWEKVKEQKKAKAKK